MRILTTAFLLITLVPQLRADTPPVAILHLTGARSAAVETLARPVEVPVGRVSRIIVDGAATLRMHVQVSEPGQVLWVTGDDDAETERFEPSATSSWSPTTSGSSVSITVEGGGPPPIVTQLAVGTPRVAVQAVCLRDAVCAAERPEVGEASRAVAMIRFVRGDASYVCTGSLIHDAQRSGSPYFLTARHCISTQEEAASIEAVWDEKAASCGITSSSGRRTTRTYGAELLVASVDTDVALLRLRKIPADRVFLTVETGPLPQGTETYRLSHAEGLPQTYSSGVVRTSGITCPSAPPSAFVYTSPIDGAVATGSSGAPLLLPGLRVAGQLLGRCGPAPDDACALANDAVDGSLAASWPLLAPFLEANATSRRRAVRR